MPSSGLHDISQSAMPIFESFDFSKWEDPQGLDRNPLHTLVLSKASSTIDADAKLRLLLKKHPEWSFEEDAFGYSPLEYAIRFSNEPLLMVFQEEGIAFKHLMDFLGKKPPLMNQGHLNSQLRIFLSQTNPGLEPLDYFPKAGSCQGWSFVYTLYGLKAFKQIVQKISYWDAQINSLTSEEKKEIEQFINDLIWFQQTAPLVRKTNIYQQMEYQKIFSMVCPENIHMQKLWNFEGLILTEEHLLEFLDFFSQYRNSYILLTGNQHATMLYVDDDGGFHFYDPNLNAFLKPITDLKKLAKLIKIHKYEKLGKKMDGVSFFGFQFSRVGQEHREIKEVQHRKQDSVNGFTPAHYAVFENNQESMANFSGEDFLVKDSHGRSPFDYMIMMDRPVDLLMNIVESKLKELWDTHKEAIVWLLMEFDNRPVLEKLFEKQYLDDESFLKILINHIDCFSTQPLGLNHVLENAKDYWVSCLATKYELQEMPDNLRPLFKSLLEYGDRFKVMVQKPLESQDKKRLRP